MFWGQYEVKPQPPTFCENAIAKNLKGAKLCTGLKEIDRGLFPQLKALPDLRGLVHVLPQVFSSIFVISLVLAVIAKNFLFHRS